MNDTIVRLMNEAKIIDPQSGAIMHIKSANFEKFAELIVRECTDMLMLEHEEAKHNHNYYHVIANKLKKHFGI